MTKLRDRIMSNLETAGVHKPVFAQVSAPFMHIEEASFPSLGESPATDNLLLALHRADRILDMRRDKIFAEHLNITSRGEAERAVLAYGQSYMMKLRLSLSAIQDLVKELTDTCNRFKVPPSDAWINMSKGIFELAMTDDNAEEDEDDDLESNRLLPNL